MSTEEKEKKARRKFAIPAQIRLALELRMDEMAIELAEGDLTKDEAADLVATVVGGALGMVAELVGAPDKAQDLIKKLGAKLVVTIAEALKPDPEKLLDKANEAMREGNFGKARRLMDKAERVQQRQSGE